MGLSRRLVVLAAGVVLAATPAPPAHAAHPIKGGRYAGHTSASRDAWIAFNVNDGGTAATSDPAAVLEASEVDLACTGYPWDLGGGQGLDERRAAFGEATI